MKPLKEGPAQDARLRGLVPRLETLPGPLRDGVVQLLEGLLLAHQVTQLGREAQRELRPRSGEAAKASD